MLAKQDKHGSQCLLACLFGVRSLASDTQPTFEGFESANRTTVETLAVSRSVPQHTLSVSLALPPLATRFSPGSEFLIGRRSGTGVTKY